jgi:opacity protein-like surface antigen
MYILGMKLLLLLSLLIGLCLQSKAQDVTNSVQSTPFRTKAVYFGARLGGNFSTLNFNRGYPKPATTIENNWKPGFTGGLFLGARLNEKLALQQEYLWSRIQGRETGSETNYVFDYLSLPLMMQYAILPRLSLMAGPQVDVLIQAKERVNGQTKNTTHDTEERSIGATAGVAVRVLSNLSLTARYTHGLNHITLEKRQSLQEFKFQSVQASVAVAF